MQLIIVTSETLCARNMEISRLPLKEITLHASCWKTVRPVSSYLNKVRGEKLISRSTGSNMSKNYATLTFVNHFSLADVVTWGWPNLSRGWQHIKLRNHFQSAVPCCIENGWARPFFMTSSKAILLLLLVVCPNNFLSIIRQ